MAGSDRKVLVATLLAIAAMKLALVVAVGPGMAPDTVGYTAFAERILGDRGWWTDAGLDQNFMAVTAFRMIGYPALIALTMSLSPEAWAWLLVGGQMLLSLAASAVCLLVAIRLGLAPLVAAAATIAAATSLPLVLDQMVLTDSLAASLFIIVLGQLVLGALNGRPLRLAEAAGLGGLLALAFLLREGTVILAALFVLPLTARLLASPAATRRRGLAAAAIYFVPLAVTAHAYQTWNDMRTGQRFITTGGQTAYVLALVYAAKADPLVFSGDTALDRAARAHLASYDFTDAVRINQHLFDEGYRAPEIAATARAGYAEAWRSHPLRMARIVLRNLRGHLGYLAVRPINSVREAVFWVTGERPWPPREDLGRLGFSEGRPGMAVLFALESGERAASILVTLAFLLLPPLWLARAVRSRDIVGNARLAAVVALWLFYLGFLVAHAMVHLEPRYMAPVQPFAVVIGFLGIQLAVVRLRRRAVAPLPRHSPT